MEQKLVLTHCWIDPQGKQHVVGQCGHSSFAYDMGAKGEYELESKGWLHVSFVYDKPIVNPAYMTQAHMNTLWDMAMLDPESTRAKSILKYLVED